MKRDAYEIIRDLLTIIPAWLGLGCGFISILLVIVIFIIERL